MEPVVKVNHLQIGKVNLRKVAKCKNEIIFVERDIFKENKASLACFLDSKSERQLMRLSHKTKKRTKTGRRTGKITKKLANTICRNHMKFEFDSENAMFVQWPPFEHKLN